MRYFNLNDYTDYIQDEKGERFEFNPKTFYRFHSDNDNKCVIPRDCSNGHIASKQEINSIIVGLIEFMSTFEQSDVDEFNQEIVEEQRKQQEEEMKKVLEPKKRNYLGYVYFIQDNMNNTKIGLSKDLGSRFKTYTEMPYDPEMIHYIYCSDMVRVEEYFHKYFGNKRFKGEWFKLNEKDIKFIKSNNYCEEINDLIIKKPIVAL